MILPLLPSPSEATQTMRDWPKTLRRNAACCELAAAIFRARGECYGGSWDLTEQPPSVRSAYILRADELLKTLAPGPVLPFQKGPRL